MSVLIFFIVLFILVLVHEWGHFIVAKKTGMKVDEFGIGFPPKAFGIKWGETEYTINWLPIGGFVRIYGENLEEISPAESKANDQEPEALVEVAESGATGTDSERAFSARPKWAQALVLVAGVVMNILFAWFLLVVTLMIGVPTAVDEVSASPAAQLYIASTVEDSPAAVLPTGAEITGVSAGGKSLAVLQPQAFSDFVTANAPGVLAIEYEEDGQTKTSDVTPVQGLSESEPDRYLVGVSLALVEDKQSSFFVAIKDGTMMTIDIFVSIFVGVAGLIGQSLSGTADYSQVAGPVGIVGMVGDAAAFGLASLLTFTAVISLNLAVINLLPLPALDGGRLVFVAIEAVTGKHIPAIWAARVNLAGFALLMLLMLAVTYNDIIRLL